MNCINCIYSINERHQCLKASPEIKECKEYTDKHKLEIMRQVSEMLEE